MIFKKKQPQTVPKLDPNNIPAHIAFIMDGNGRWAKKRNMPRTYGHHEGTKDNSYAGFRSESSRGQSDDRLCILD